MSTALSRHLRSVLAITSLLLSVSAQAESPYPDRPITLIFPWSTGSGIDAVTRAFAQKLGAELGQPVVVQPRPGGSSVIGANQVARAAPDGYTLLIGDGGTFSVVNQLRKTPVFDSLNDFTQISLVVKTPYAIFTNAASPINDLSGLIAEARTNPGKLAYGNVGIGSVGHLAVEDFSRKAGIKLLSVPYKGSGEVLAALMGGTLQLSLSGGALNHAQTGRVRALAVASAQRLAAAPDIPTIREATGIDTVTEAWWGIAAPPGTPPDIVAKLNGAIGKVAGDPELQAQFASWGFVFASSTPQAFRDRIKADAARWKTVIADSGIPQSD